MFLWMLVTVHCRIKICQVPVMTELVNPLELKAPGGSGARVTASPKRPPAPALLWWIYFKVPAAPATLLLQSSDRRPLLGMSGFRPRPVAGSKGLIRCRTWSLTSHNYSGQVVHACAYVAKHSKFGLIDCIGDINFCCTGHRPGFNRPMSSVKPLQRKFIPHLCSSVWQFVSSLPHYTGSMVRVGEISRSSKPWKAYSNRKLTYLVHDRCRMSQTTWIIRELSTLPCPVVIVIKGVLIRVTLRQRCSGLVFLASAGYPDPPNFGPLPKIHRKKCGRGNAAEF